MNVNTYFIELEGYLKDLKNKDEIIKELKAVALDDDYDSLVKRFGEPKEFALNYLDELPKEEKKSNTLKYLAYGFILIFLALFFIIKNMFSDPFDYSKYDANTVIKKVENNWHKLENINTLDINQSKVVIYFTNEKENKYSCKEKTLKVQEGNLDIRHKSCYLILNNKNLEIKSNQANIVLVEPLNLDIDAKQSSIEFAKKDSKYNFEVDKNESSLEEIFTSSEAKIKIKVKLYQASFETYKY